MIWFPTFLLPYSKLDSRCHSHCLKNIIFTIFAQSIFSPLPIGHLAKYLDALACHQSSYSNLAVWWSLLFLIYTNHISKERRQCLLCESHHDHHCPRDPAYQFELNLHSHNHFFWPVVSTIQIHSSTFIFSSFPPQKTEVSLIINTPTLTKPHFMHFGSSA